MLRTLCFSGGGIAGFVHLGVLDYLENHKLLNSVDSLFGTSAGALIAGLFAMGLSAKIILKEFLYLSKDDVLSYSCIEKFFHVLGLDNGEYLMAYITDVLLKYEMDPLMTFEELYTKKRKNLFITGSNLSTESAEYYCKDFHPDMKILSAIRISIAMPGIFTFVQQSIDDTFHCLIDGSAADHYPIESALAYFKSQYPFEDERKGVLGVLLKKKSTLQSVNGITDYLIRLYTTITNQKCKDKCTIEISLYNVHSFDFDLCTSERLELYNRGKNETEKYMKSLQSYTRTHLQRRKSC